MDRATALAYVTEEFADLATETGWPSDVIALAYLTAIDQSLRQLGYRETDLPTANVDQASVVKYLALLDYYALLRYSKYFTIRVDVLHVAGSFSALRSQTYKGVQRLLAEAEKRLIHLGIGPVESFTLGRFTLDFQEPGLGQF